MISQRADERDQTAAELQKFRRSALLFSARGSLIDSHEGRWVAAVEGEVKAEAGTFDEVFRRMDELGIDPRYAIVRHIQRNQRTLII